MNITRSIQDRVFLGVIGGLFMFLAGYVLYTHHTEVWSRQMSVGARLLLFLLDEFISTVFLLAFMTKTVVSVTKTVVSMTKTVVSATKTVDSATKTVVSVTKTVDSATESVDSATESVVSVTKTVVSATKTVANFGEVCLAEIFGGWFFAGSRAAA